MNEVNDVKCSFFPSPSFVYGHQNGVKKEENTDAADIEVTPAGMAYLKLLNFEQII